mgnify:CR=1 FL=1
MGKIHDVQKLTDNRFVNLYHVDATSVHNTPVSYYVASRAKDIPSLKMKTGRNDPDGVIIYSVYGEKKDKVVLIRQYRYALGGYIYEFPAGLVEPNEDFHEGAVREMHEETGLKLEPLKVDSAYEKPYFTTIGMTDESCATVYGYASGPGGHRRDRGRPRRPRRGQKDPQGRKCCHHVCLHADAFSQR